MLTRFFPHPGCAAALLLALPFLQPPSTAVAAQSLPGLRDDQRILSVDHYIPVRSTAPGMSGQTASLYLRERVNAGLALRARELAGRVVLFVHGAGTPAEVAFDTGYEDYSWMAYLADAGFDTFALDVTGYGRSTRPSAMNDPCSLSEQQRATVLGESSRGCPSFDGSPVTTIASDWDDIAAAVDYIRALRDVESISIVAWSLGGPRSGGYAARNPGRVEKLVLLAPAYNRGSSGAPPASLVGGGAPMNIQSRADFEANWDRQVGCSTQYDPAIVDVVWGEMLESDPVGATWASGVRRAPRTPTWGWNSEVVAASRIPTLIISPVHDGQVPPARVMELYEDLGAPEKVLIDLGCASHNAHWERNHTLMFEASREWLLAGTVDGARQGIVKMGY